ncbi:MAG TPA: tRNA uridine-5-carboxymethylaminomethyl(34) synthesis GTPase MnmE [Thermoleophilia bacterium]|nr:tRNA uridine-5-carboxymethylaminomethyl(34) synthesis GTPase MnmE [Thermoleophilia bacterium]
MNPIRPKPNTPDRNEPTTAASSAAALPQVRRDAAAAGIASPHADTIVAVSTAAGAGAIGIVRMSGPRAVELGDGVFRPAHGGTLGASAAGRVRYGHVIDPERGVVVDEVLAVAMRAPSTYTREDVVEIHCHGGPAAQRAVLQLLMHSGARAAEPGEFTQRAYLNGRIDLTQAESVAGIVQARTSSALRACVRQLSGGLSQRLREVRAGLVGCLAQLEAGIDFTDEDIEELDREALALELEKARADLGILLDTAFLGRALENGVRTAIVGRPNVGKSSLLNALLMRERAIVSDLPGTTRDTIEELIEVAGIPLHLIDTAGLRPSKDVLERLGIERSHEAMREADLVLAILDLSAPIQPEDAEMVGRLDPRRTIIVGNKRDKVAAPPAAESGWPEYLASMLDGVVEPDGGLTEHRQMLAVSALTGEGMDALRALIEQVVVGEGGIELDEPILATERQRSLVEDSATAIDATLRAIRRGLAEELIAEDVRVAILALGRITGDELVPDLIDEIFRRFCIGK